MLTVNTGESYQTVANSDAAWCAIFLKLILTRLFALIRHFFTYILSEAQLSVDPDGSRMWKEFNLLNIQLNRQLR